MPESERDIEKILRASAQKRREEAGAPVEMHPATRRLLHGEIARLRGKTRDKSGFWTRIFGSSWPQIALRVSVTVLLVCTAALFLLPFLSKPKTELATLRLRDKQTLTAKQPGRKRDGSTLEDLPLAKKDRVPGAVVLDGKEPAPKSRILSAGEAQFAAMPPPTASAEKDKFVAGIDSLANKPLPESAQVASGTFGDFATNSAATPSRRTLAFKQENSDYSSVPTGAVATAPAAAAPANPQSNLIASRNTSTIQPATPPPAPAVVSSGSLVAADREPLGMNLDASGAAANSVTQQFIRTIQPAKIGKALKSPGKIVLNSFRVIQTGNQIRVIDSDGSIYSGFVGQAGEGAKPASVPVESIAVPGTPQGNAAVARQIQPGQNEPLGGSGAGSAVQPIQNYFFRVSGTNLSLNQPVVFSGSFIAGVQLPPSAKTTVTNGLAETKSPAPTTGPASLQLLNSQLHGRVVIGGTNQFEINALPVKH